MKVPYEMKPAVTIPKRHAQMAIALQYGWPRLEQVEIDDSRVLNIACYGPSLQDTWQDLQHPILSMSGATKWLAERGVIADYHIDMDPRQNKVDDVTPVIPGVKYLMATVCHPDVFKILKDTSADVVLWHVYSAEETYDWVGGIETLDNQLVIRGGSTIGLTAFQVGGILGYRHFEVHGMDGSFKDLDRAERHAGPHSGHKQNKDGITWPVNRKTYATSKIMANAVAETLNTIANYPIYCVFHGEGLTQALMRKHNFNNACCADEVGKAARVRQSTVHVLDKLILDPGLMSVASTAWRVLMGPMNLNWADAMMNIRSANEFRRKQAHYNTGTVTYEQMLQLRGVCEVVKPHVIVEIGTFIGNSTMAMKAEHIFTCDRSNNCFESTETIHYYPETDSTAMLMDVVRKCAKVDLFFFDGRIQPADLGIILSLTHEGTVFLFDDYVGNEKGVVNAKLLATTLPRGWWLIEPDPLVRHSTLAAIAPLGMFRT